FLPRLDLLLLVLTIKFLWKSRDDDRVQRQSPNKYPSNTQHGPFPRHTALPVMGGYKTRRLLPRRPPELPGKSLTSSGRRSSVLFPGPRLCHPPSVCFS